MWVENGDVIGQNDLYYQATTANTALQRGTHALLVE
jgi:hypothetical protein